MDVAGLARIRHGIEHETEPLGLSSALLQALSELVEQVAEGRIVSDAVRDQIVSVDHGRVIASETLADNREGVVGQFAAKVHRDLAAQRQMLGASSRHEIDQPHVEIDRDSLLNGSDGDLAILSRDQIAQGLARELHSDRAVIEGGQRHQPVQTAFEFAHVGKNVLGDILSDLRGQEVAVICGLLLQDGDTSFEVGRRNVGGEAAFETIAQAVLKPGDVTRNLVRGQNDLVVSGMQRIEGVKQFLLSPLAAGQELHVIEQERISTAELRLELPHPVGFERTYQLVREALSRHKDDPAQAFSVALQSMADGAGQVSLAETHPAVDEERIVRITRLAGGRDGRRVSKLIAGANHKFTKRLARVEGPAAVACFRWERWVYHGVSPQLRRSSNMRSCRQLCTNLSTAVHTYFPPRWRGVEPLSLGLLGRSGNLREAL